MLVQCCNDVLSNYRYYTVILQYHHKPHCLSVHLPSKRCYCSITHENVKLFYNYMLQHCNCIMGKGRGICVCVCVCVCVRGEGFTYFFLFSSLFAGI